MSARGGRNHGDMELGMGERDRKGKWPIITVVEAEGEEKESEGGSLTELKPGCNV